jgi:hypothetical protein
MNKMEITPDIVINANALRNNNIQKRHIKESITEILKRLNQELINAHREGKHFIITSLPITFDIPNMINKDSQRLIWSSILNFLLEKKYRVWINPTNDSCKIKITWINEVDEVEISEQNNIIIKHTKNF